MGSPDRARDNFFTLAGEPMRLLIALSAGAIGTLVLRAAVSTSQSIDLHRSIDFVVGFVILVVSWKLLGLLPWFGPSTEEVEYRKLIRSFLEYQAINWVNRKFIYIESGLVRHVLVSKIKVGEKGAVLSFRTLPTSGFVPEPTEFTAGTGLDTAIVREGYICEPNISWELIADEELSEQIVEEVAVFVANAKSSVRSSGILGLVRARLAGSTVISNSELGIEMIPSDAAPLTEVVAFAMSYDLRSRDRHADESADKFSSKLLGEFVESGSLPDSLDDARAFLRHVQIVATPGYRTEPARIERDLIRHIRTMIRGQSEI